VTRGRRAILPAPRPLPARIPLLPAVLLVAACASGERAGVEVPRPDLSRAEPAVREQVRAAEAALDTALARGDPTGEALGEIYGRLGMTYHAYDLRDAARACYENAERLVPRDFRWPYFLGHLHRLGGEPERAAASLERALELRADDLPALVTLADVELERSRPERAEELFTRALELDAGCAPALVGLARLALARGDVDVALARLEAARGRAPGATEIGYLLGQALRRRGELDRARALLQAGGEVPARLDDPHLDAVRALARGMMARQAAGRGLAAQGRLTEAVAAFRDAVALAPDEPRLRVNLGEALLRLGDAEGARREFEAAIPLDPAYPLAHYNAGVACARLGRDAEAVEHYRRALALDPGLLVARLNVANALFRLGRVEESLEHYRGVVERDPRHPGARLGEALALARLGRGAEARALLEQALALLPGEPAIADALARLSAGTPAATPDDPPYRDPD